MVEIGRRCWSYFQKIIKKGHLIGFLRKKNLEERTRLEVERIGQKKKKLVGDWESWKGLVVA